MFWIPDEVYSRVKISLLLISTVCTISGVLKLSTKPITTTFAWRWSVFEFIKELKGCRSVMFVVIERQKSQIIFEKIEERNTRSSIMAQYVKSSALLSSKHSPMMSSSNIHRLLIYRITTSVKHRAKMLNSEINTWLFELYRWTDRTTVRLSTCFAKSIRYSINA